MAVFSKFVTIPTTCIEYVHPWTHSCSTATTGLGWDALQESFRIYVTVYMLAMIMRGKIPTTKDIKRTLLGILQSTLFLTCNGAVFPLCICFCRYLLGHFNVLTVSFIPAFLSSYVAILIERPSRRSLLSLYVTNVASETLFRMAAWRGLVRPIPHGEVMIFAFSIAALLYFYRGQHSSKDSIYGLFRFVVGPYEEEGYTLDSKGHAVTKPYRTSAEKKQSKIHYSAILMLCNAYQHLLSRIKRLKKHPSCPHPFSCTFYMLQGAFKLFSLGYGLQVCLQLLLQMKRVVRRPRLIPQLFIHKNAFKLGAFLGGFSGIFRVTSCLLRHFFNKDSKFYAIPAGLLAGLAFSSFPDNTIALYVMWKALQIVYNQCVEKGYLPELPGFTILLYCLSTAILFHAAVLEPQNLRPSYWKFLFSISGGRISSMDRAPLDAFGLGSSKTLVEAVSRTKTTILPINVFK